MWQGAEPNNHNQIGHGGLLGQRTNEAENLNDRLPYQPPALGVSEPTWPDVAKPRVAFACHAVCHGLELESLSISRAPGHHREPVLWIG
jgi:hypothetical protein